MTDIWTAAVIGKGWERWKVRREGPLFLSKMWQPPWPSGPQQDGDPQLPCCWNVWNIPSDLSERPEFPNYVRPSKFLPKKSNQQHINFGPQKRNQITFLYWYIYLPTLDLPKNYADFFCNHLITSWGSTASIIVRSLHHDCGLRCRCGSIIAPNERMDVWGGGQRGKLGRPQAHKTFIR